MKVKGKKEENPSACDSHQSYPCEMREKYRLEPDRDKHVIYFSGESFSGEYRDYFLVHVNPDGKLSYSLRPGDQVVEPGKYMFVLSLTKRLYVMPLSDTETKVSSFSLSYKHSSFFGGKAVICAGELIIDEYGCVKKLNSRSGHYRPSPACFNALLIFLRDKMTTTAFRGVNNAIGSAEPSLSSEDLSFSRASL